MKKIIIAILIVLVGFSAAAETKETLVQPLVGYLYGEISFSVNLIDEVLPFNLASPEVAERTTSNMLSGLRIGTYSLIASNVSFKLYVTHGKMVLKERIFGIEDEGTLSAIDYRLYMETGSNNNFQSCLSDISPNVESYSNLANAFTNKILIDGQSINYTNQGFYVSLEDRTMQTTEATVAALKAGTYASDIYFYLEVGD